MKNYFIFIIATALLNGLFGQNLDKSFDKALTHINNQEFSSAIPILEKLQQKNPEKLNVKLQLAFCYRQTDKIEKSIKLYQKIIEQRPGYAPGFYMLANAYFAENSLDKALEMCNKTLEIDNNEGTYLLLKGQILLRKGDKKSACKSFKKAKRKGSQDAKRNIQKYCK